MVRAGEAAEFFIPIVTLDGQLSGAAGKQIKQLGKEGAARVHGRIVVSELAKYEQEKSLGFQIVHPNGNAFGFAKTEAIVP
jgi:hypothetical protein